VFSAIAATADGADADMVFPNVEKELPKARATMWRYEPDGNGWAPYGMGTVSADGRQVVPDPGVMITDFASAECEPTKRTHQPPMKRPDLWRQNPMGFGSGQAPVNRRRGGETMSGTNTSGISQQELRSLSLRRTSLHRAGVDSMIGAGLSGKLLRLLLVLMLSIEPGLIELANATTSSTAERKDVPATLQMPAEKIETAKIKIETASLRDAPSDPAPEGSPPLRSAADGITAVAGRVLATDGTALAGVVLRLDRCARRPIRMDCSCWKTSRRVRRCW
jgi:hypothetical protein